MVIFCGVGQAIAAGAIALLIRHTFDALLRNTQGPSTGEALLAGAGFIIAGIAIYALRVIERGAAEAFAQKYIAELRRRIFSRVINSDYGAFRRKRRGHLMVRFVGDLGAVRNWIADGLSQVTVAAIVVPFVSAVLISIHPKIMSIVLLILVMGFLAIFLLRQSLKQRHADARLNRGRMAGEFGEKLTNAPVVAAYGQNRREGRRLSHRSENLIQASVARRRHTALATGIPDCTAAVAMSVIIVLGVLEINSGNATPGAIIALLTALSLIVAPLRELASVFDRWRSFSVAREKLGNLLSIPQLNTAPRRGTPLREGNGKLSFKSVSIDGLLTGFSAKVPAFTVVAITGPNGVGKSVLLRASAALASLDSGSIHLDGCDYRKTRRQHLRKAIGVYSTDLPLLRGSIRRNILYGARGVSERDLAELIRATGLAPLLDSLPKGLETQITEGGSELSAGWRARIMLARAIAGRPRLLVLDEPEASLDGDGLKTLQDLLNARQQTILLATQSPDLLSKADQIWDLNGTAIEIKPAAQPLSERPLVRPLRLVENRS